MNALMSKPSIYRSELLHCGCRVDPATGTHFVVCEEHSRNYPEVTMMTIVSDALPNRDGLKPLCPECGSLRLVPAKDGVDCLACNANFAAEDIVSYGLSVDSKPRYCPNCNSLHYGQGEICSICAASRPGESL